LIEHDKGEVAAADLGRAGAEQACAVGDGLRADDVWSDIDADFFRSEQRSDRAVGAIRGGQ
jgi:hypothetical protein